MCNDKLSLSYVVQKLTMKWTSVVLILSVSLSLYAKKPRSVVGCKPVYKDRVFMKETEVSNFNYYEFVYSVHRSEEELKELLPDTTVWRKKNEYNEPYVEYYFRHPAYREYPVVGVSKEQAEKYCEWLSGVLTDKYRKDDKSDIDSVVVRLPIKREWIDAAKGGNDYYEYPWEGHDVRITEKGKWQGDMRANFVRGKGDYMGIAGALNDNADVTAPVHSYWPNDFGLYNCAGNVAELVADDNVAMGGSWRSLGYDIKVTSEINAIEPSAQIGFRYLVEVVKLKPTKVKPLRIDKKFAKNNLEEMDSMLMSKYEVTNELYNLFLTETRHSPQDTTLWNDQFIYSNWFTCNYRWHPMYGKYPAVGMTKKDITKFCEWMTQKLQPFYDEKIQVDLPTEKEWELFARGGLELSPYPWGGPYTRNSKGFLLANYRYTPDAFKTRDAEGRWIVQYPRSRHSMFGADQDGFLGCAPENFYNPNGYNMYNISGNVRELLSDSDEFTKGGGWNSEEVFLQISQREFYESIPAADIGFRYIVRRVK